MVDSVIFSFEKSACHSDISGQSISTEIIHYQRYLLVHNHKMFHIRSGIFDSVIYLKAVLAFGFIYALIFTHSQFVEFHHQRFFFGTAHLVMLLCNRYASN